MSSNSPSSHRYWRREISNNDPDRYHKREREKKKNIIKFYISYIHWSSSLLFLLLVYRFELRLKQTNKPFSIMIFNWFYNKMTILINLTFEKQQDTAFFLANHVGDTINFVYTRCDNRTWEFFDVNDNTSTSRMAII